MDLGDALRTRIETGLEAAVTKYFDREFDANVTVSPQGHETEIDCNVHLPSGIILQSTGRASEPYAALEAALAKIEKRVRRYKRRLKDHHKPGRTPFPSEPAASFVLRSPSEEEDEAVESGGDDGEAPLIVAETPSEIRTMTVSEAVLQLDVSDAPAVMFRNAKHAGLNMVYRRADGNIGWVDPANTSKS